MFIDRVLMFGRLRVMRAASMHYGCYFKKKSFLNIFLIRGFDHCFGRFIERDSSSIAVKRQRPIVELHSTSNSPLLCTRKREKIASVFNLISKYTVREHGWIVDSHCNCLIGVLAWTAERCLRNKINLLFEGYRWCVHFFIFNYPPLLPCFLHQYHQAQVIYSQSRVQHALYPVSFSPFSG